MVHSHLLSSINLVGSDITNAKEGKAYKSMEHDPWDAKFPGYISSPIVNDVRYDACRKRLMGSKMKNERVCLVGEIRVKFP